MSAADTIWIWETRHAYALKPWWFKVLHRLGHGVGFWWGYRIMTHGAACTVCAKFERWE